MSKKYVVIDVSNDLTGCVAICSDCYSAVGKAYDYASELIGSENDKGTVTPIMETNGETGYMLTARYGDKNDLKTDIFILFGEERNV